MKATAKARTLLTIGLLLAGVQAVAHHPLEIADDMTRPVTLRGAVTGMEWVNPHAFAKLDVKDAGGRTVHWLVALSSASSLSRLGMTRNSFKPGDPMSVDVWVARDGSPHADVREGSTLVLPGGMKIVFPYWAESIQAR